MPKMGFLFRKGGYKPPPKPEPKIEEDKPLVVKKDTPYDKAVRQFEQKGYYTTDPDGKFNVKAKGYFIRHNHHPLQSH